MTSATTILCQFLCKNRSCRRSIVLPQHTLSQAFEHRDIPPTEIPRVALVCARCKTVENYSEADLQGAGEGDTDPTWGVAELLQCVEGSCQLLLPVFAKWSGTTSVEDRSVDVHIWRWKPLTCEAGHEVRKPESVYGYSLLP